MATPPRIQHHASASPELAAECGALLRSLPAWFGIPGAIADYQRSVEGRACLEARAGTGELLGFLHLLRHFPGAAEIHVIAVAEASHRTGLGSALVTAAEQLLRADGCRLLQVKTLAAAAKSEPYDRTRAFYLAQGFDPLEVLPELWDAHNPCLVLVKALG